MAVTLADVNVLIYAFARNAPDHIRYRGWLERTVAGPEPFAVSELVLSAVVRIVTRRGAVEPAEPLEQAVAYVTNLRNHPRAKALRPGPRHWDLFTDLCQGSGASGNLVADAYHAALAIEHGCEWITTDRDFARFPGLRWRHPLDGGRR